MAFVSLRSLPLIVAFVCLNRIQHSLTWGIQSPFWHFHCDSHGVILAVNPVNLEHLFELSLVHEWKFPARR